MRPYEPHNSEADDQTLPISERPLPSDDDMSDPAWPNLDTTPAAPVTPAGTIGSVGPDVPAAPNVENAPHAPNPSVDPDDSGNADGSTLSTPGAPSSAVYRAKAMPPDAIDVTPADRRPAFPKTDGLSNHNSRDGANNTGDTGDTGDLEAMRADIEHTRSQMSATIDAIQEKLNPHNLVDQAKGAVREATIGRVENMVSDVRNTAQEAGNGLLETIKQNPFPAALAAVGIGWLFMKSRNNNDAQNRYRYASYNNYSTYDDYNYPRYGVGDRYGYRPLGEQYERPSGPGEMIGNAQDRVGDAANQVKQKVGDAASQAGSAISDAAGQVRDTMGDVAGRAGDAAGGLVDNTQQRMGDIGTNLQYGAQRAQNSLQRMLYENPLAVGAAALVAGAAIGMMLPETEPEHRLMGEARDNVMNKAQEVAQDTMDKVSRVAEQATTTAKQEAKSQGLTS